MKSLIASTETSATYEFYHGSASRQVTYKRADDASENPNFEAMATEDHAQWLNWIGVTEE